jgi:hypothetical protein
MFSAISRQIQHPAKYRVKPAETAGSSFVSVPLRIKYASVAAPPQPETAAYASSAAAPQTLPASFAHLSKSEPPQRLISVSCEDRSHARRQPQ